MLDRGKSSTSRPSPEISPVPIQREIEWAPETVGTFWRREKSLRPVPERTPGYPGHSLETMFTELSRLATVNVIGVLILKFRRMKNSISACWRVSHSHKHTNTHTHTPLCSLYNIFADRILIRFCSRTKTK